MRVAVAAMLMGVLSSGGLATTPVAAHEVEIVAHDYAFASPTELPAGRTIFRFTNKGKVIHELSVELLKNGTTVQQVMNAVNVPKQPFKPLIEASVGIMLARPGERSSAGLSTSLLAGRNYLVVCRFQDSASAPKHFRMGMLGVIHVSAEQRDTTASARVDTIIGTEYAFRAARTLAPGNHTIAFVNAGTVDHELNIALLRPGVTLEQVFAIAKVDSDLNGLVEEWLGVLAARAGSSPLGSFRVRLLPNREYVLMCQFENGDKPPSHLAMGMFGSIRTTGAKQRRAESNLPLDHLTRRP
jgi:hypothetical protein